MDLSHQSDADILAIADPIMDNLTAASSAIDYDRHTRDFTERARRALSRDALQTICEHYQCRPRVLRATGVRGNI